MKHEFLKILSRESKTKPKKLYNELLEEYSQVAGVRQVYHYQLGYTPTKLENLKYEIKKSQGISDKEIALYDPANEPEDLTPQQAEGVSAALGDGIIVKTGNEDLDAGRTPEEIKILFDLDQNADAKDGLKLRDEYPFLNDERTPDAIKALVTDKISAYKKYAALHAEALQAADEAEAEDKLYELASEALKNYELNQDIKAELDFFRDGNGKVLGKHPKLKDLRIEQEIGEMTEAELVKHRQNALKSVSKYAKAGNADKENEWAFRLQNTEARLENDFKYKFEK